jgi:hypothetical protein
VATEISRIIDEALQLTNRVDSQHRTRARVALGRGVEYWAERLPWPGLKRYEAFASNGTRFMAFPERVRKVISVSDITDKLPVKPGDHWNREHSTLWLQDLQADPLEWRDLGLVATISDPVTDSTLTIEATVSEALTVYVTGLARDTNASGTALELYEARESFAITGTGATDTTTAFVRVTSLEKSVEAGLADVTVKSSVDSKPLARLAANDSAAEYRRIEYLTVPNAGRQYRLEYYTKPSPIVNETSPLPPSIDRDYLVWRIVGDLHWTAEQPDAARAAWQKADGLLMAHQNAERTHGEDYAGQITPEWRYGRSWNAMRRWR